LHPTLQVRAKELRGTVVEFLKPKLDSLLSSDDPADTSSMHPQDIDNRMDTSLERPTDDENLSFD